MSGITGAFNRIATMKAINSIATGDTNHAVASEKIYNAKNVSQIPSYCARLAALLAKQPLFQGSGSLAKQSQVVALREYGDARICEIFNDNAKSLLGDKAWDIRSFGCGNHQLFEPNFHHIPAGITHWVYGSINSPPDDLEDKYEQVREKLSAGWVHAKPEDHGNIMFKENPADFYLFLKKKPTLSEEDTLIRSLARKFSMEQNVKCNDERLRPEQMFSHGDDLYMWVRKSSFQQVVDIFGFKLDESSL